MDFIREHCAERGVRVALSEVFAKGGEGGQALADEVLAVLDESKADFHMLYEDSLPLGGQDPQDRQGDLRCTRVNHRACRKEGAGKHHRDGLRQPAGLRCKDAVFALR